jgi:GT2 family glycosyltransferase
MTPRALHPVMAVGDGSGEPDPGAVWVGAIEVREADLTDGLVLEGGEAFGRARLLVWQAGCVRGFVELAVSGGAVSGVDLAAALGRLAPLTRSAPPASGGPISVVICTRDRPDDLRRCLAAVLALDYPEFEVVVVDSASATAATRAVVTSLASGRPRYLRVDQPGLSRARNTGVRAAAHELVAFLDDDVIVDPRWLRGISAGFASGPDVVCVTGIVASGQLLTRAQRSMDRRLTWARNVNVTRFSLADPPAAYPLFPFQFGAYGTGAGFASRRSTLFELGGFDEALGVGTPTGGGEDLDWFTRVVLAGHTLLYAPDALVWHKHRLTDAELSSQLEAYGVGLGALLAKLAAHPAARRAMLSHVVRGVRHARRMVSPEQAPGQRAPRSGNAARELLAIARGPLALRRARRHGAAAPLLAVDSSRS